MGTRPLSHVASLAARHVFLGRSQWWPRERLDGHRLRHLKALLAGAGETTAFYRSLMRECGFSPERDIQTIDDLSRLPLLDKQTLLRAPLGDRLVRGAQPERLIRRRTSGSTAEPFEVYLSQYEKDARVLLELRMLGALGEGPRSRMFEMRRQDDLSAGSGMTTFLGLFPRRGMSYVNSAQAKLDALRESRCRVFKAHLSSLVPMAQLIVDGSLPPPPDLRCIISCAEYLDEPARRLVQDAFGVPVHDQYGTVEFGFIAWECPRQDALHVSIEDFVVEVVDEAGKPCPPGSCGEVVVTALKQTTMPLIRYRTGDRAMWLDSPCACGRTLPRLRLVRGRTMDLIVRADGSEVSAHFFTTLWEGVEGIRQFQICQDSLNRLTYRYVLHPGADQPAVEGLLRKRLEDEFGPGTHFAFERVESIAPEVSGKLKYLHSRITGPISESPG